MENNFNNTKDIDLEDDSEEEDPLDEDKLHNKACGGQANELGTTLIEYFLILFAIIFKSLKIST